MFYNRVQKKKKKTSNYTENVQMNGLCQQFSYF